MTTFDADLVGRWFGALVEQDPAADGSWSLRPTQVERQVLDRGGRAIAAAVGRSQLPPGNQQPAEPAAGVLQAYLSGMASGIAGARQTMADSGDLDDAPVADRLCLVAGLIAGGVAVQVGSYPVGDGQKPASEAGALAAAAGTAAAELVVDGADLSSITTAAAAAALAAGPSDAANRDPGYRAKALVASVLVGLQRSTAPVREPIRPPSCGARPGVNVGAPLTAEVTFTCFLPQEVSDRLEATVAGLSHEVVVWSEGDRRYFHVHTETAGEVIAEAYAVGAVFSLVIGRLA